jgi:hypothetical protein
MAGLKIKFSKNIFDRMAQLLASKGSKKHLLVHIESPVSIVAISLILGNSGPCCAILLKMINANTFLDQIVLKFYIFLVKICKTLD